MTPLNLFPKTCFSAVIEKIQQTSDKAEVRPLTKVSFIVLHHFKDLPTLTRMKITPILIFQCAEVFRKSEMLAITFPLALTQNL